MRFRTTVVVDALATPCGPSIGHTGDLRRGLPLAARIVRIDRHQELRELAGLFRVHKYTLRRLNEIGGSGVVAYDKKSGRKIGRFDAYFAVRNVELAGMSRGTDPGIVVNEVGRELA